MNTTSQVLAQVHTILAAPGVWIQGSLCATSTGETGVPLHKADCFCLYGAECRALIDTEIKASEARSLGRYLRAAIRELFPDRDDTIPRFNDDPRTTHADVLAVVVRAQELASR